MPGHLELAIWEDQTSHLRRAVERAQGAVRNIAAIMGLVPREWWAAGAVHPAQLQTVLEDRAGRLESIVDVNKWEGIKDATKGGHILNL